MEINGIKLKLKTLWAPQLCKGSWGRDHWGIGFAWGGYVTNRASHSSLISQLDHFQLGSAWCMSFYRFTLYIPRILSRNLQETRFFVISSESLNLLPTILSKENKCWNILQWQEGEDSGATQQAPAHGPRRQHPNGFIWWLVHPVIEQTTFHRSRAFLISDIPKLHHLFKKFGDFAE